MKKALSILLSALLLFMFTLPAFAANGADEETVITDSLITSGEDEGAQEATFFDGVKTTFLRGVDAVADIIGAFFVSILYFFGKFSLA